MKRRLAVTIVVTALILALGLFGEYSGDRLAKAFVADMLPIEGLIAEENWPDALTALGDIQEEWERRNALIQMWTNHGDIDHISLGLKSLRAALLTQGKTEAMTSYFELVENFGHLHHRDAFTIKNIL